VLGSDVAGTVERSRAEGFVEGEEVFGLASSGGYAELATALATGIAKRPPGVSVEQAAALPVAGLTAWQALFDHGRLAQGQTALIAGAAGGVGHLALQFAEHAGARAIGIASARNRDFVLGLGADEYVDYTKQDVAGSASGVDLAFDTVGGQTTEALLPTIRRGGRLITIAGAPPQEAADERGVHAEAFSMSPNAGQLAEIADLVAAGDVHVEIAATLPLGEVGRAHALIESGHARGKIILSVGA
jgi:NADPH:quinone reductase-like Zn-dependent oxidoreductase